MKGLSDDLFWPSRAGEPLVIREGFAFFPQGYTTGSQADVYFTIAAVLHARRSLRSGKDSLHQQEHVRKVLSPRCFDRFNDGVIQAAFLRAATRPELDYAIDENISKEMWQVLDFILRAKGQRAGEAYREFLIAMALGRLRLQLDDLRQLHEDHGAREDDPIDQLLWKKILEEFSRRIQEPPELAVEEPIPLTDMQA